MTEEHVVDHGQFGCERQILVHGFDPGLLRIPNGLEVHRLVSDDELAGIRFYHSEERLQEGGLPGTVVSEERHDLTRVDSDIRIGKCLDVTESFGDVPTGNCDRSSSMRRRVASVGGIWRMVRQRWGPPRIERIRVSMPGTGAVAGRHGRPTGATADILALLE